MSKTLSVWESPSGRFHKRSTCAGRNSKLFRKRDVTEQEILAKGYQGNCQCMKLVLNRIDKRTWQARAAQASTEL